MNTIARKDLLGFLTTLNIKLTEISINSQYFTFSKTPLLARFWEFPIQTNRLSDFLVELIEGMGGWRTLFISPASRFWPDDNCKSNNECIRNSFYRQFGIKANSEDGLAESSSDKYTIAAFLLVNILFLSDLFDDLFVIPDNGKFICRTDHHGVLRVEFLSHSTLNAFVKHMKSKGFDLPIEVPDGTFYKPDWMPS